MNFVNPPAESPQYVTHITFYSQVLNHDIGYNIYPYHHLYNKGDRTVGAAPEKVLIHQ